MKTELTDLFPKTIVAFGFTMGIAALANPAAGEANVTSEEAAFFESKILPVLADSCFECHSKEAGQKKGGISLDTRFGLRDGGNSGPGVVPGVLDESWLWLSVSHTEPDYEMPPKSKLPDEVIADFKKWIEMGAPDPRKGEEPVSSEIDIEAGKQFWSFQTPTRQSPPEVDEAAWSRTMVDRFVFAKLEEEELKPAPAADAHGVLRRLCFDLIGMPPSLEFTQRFHRAWKENPMQAIQSTVDQLMRSQQFGERWGKHWLDLARYAESNGKGSNQAYPNAWRYRDYVIDAMNQDKPIDRFIMEQLAGDVLPIKSDEDWQENLIATGFLAVGPKDLREMNRRQFIMEMVDEQINTVSTALLGLTVGCARCHDHKTDPIPTQDYYAMAGIFLSSNTLYGTDGVGGRYNQADLIRLPLAGKTNQIYDAAEIAAMKAELVEVRQGLQAHAEKKRAMMQGEIENDGRSSAKRLREQQSKLEAALGSISGEGAVHAFAMGMTEKTEVADTAILVRGEVDSPAQTVPRGFLQVLDRSAVEIADGSSGRLEMAMWIASNQNPLTARVFVNRVWEKLFGQGLVSSVDNFGTTGMAPTHPELLDQLAIQFMEDGWSLKKLVRSLVITRTYLSSSEFNSANYSKDPDNHFLWRAAPRRLDAESFRDAILATSKQLLYERPFRSPVAEMSMEELGRKGSPNVHYQFPPYRSVYVPPIREGMHEMINIFDGADPELTTGKREESNGAEQSLYLMNNPFVLEQSGHFAELVEEHSNRINDQIRYAFLRAYGRPPTRGETESATRFHREFTKTGSDREFLTLFCQGLLCSAEFRYIN